jgi:predicted nucleotidyltransferase
MNLVTRIEFGSHLYGTNTPQSDHDYKGVRIPSAREILLQRVKDSTGHQVIRPEGERNTPEDTDDETYSLQAYLKLLAEGQTVAIDMLFAPKPIVITPLWEHIKENRRKLLTKKSASFLGYCRTQANKYGIKGSRVSSAKKAMEFFAKAIEIYGPHSKLEYVDYVLGTLEDDHTIARVTKETTAGKFENYFQCCNRMVGYKNTFKEAHSIYSRIYEEYGKRARLAEANEGVDWKALSHAVRVGYEAIELLQTANVTFPLPYAERILNIKLGKFPYKAVAEEIEGLLVLVEHEAKISDLRDEPDYEWIDNLIIKHYGQEVFEYIYWHGKEL